MVWILSPVNPSLGPSKYYFTSPGTFKVGRKDCAVIIQTDKTVSRLHAEFKVDPIESSNLSKGFANIPRPSIHLKDLSKFGSFVNKNTGSKPVFSLTDQEVILKEGDLVTFGTNNSTFRLKYLPFLFHIAPLTDKSRQDAVISAVVSMGGHTVEEWCAECTHLVVEEGSFVTETVVRAVAERKPVIGTGWIEAVAARSCPSSEFPSFSRFVPNLLLKMDGDATLVKIAEPEVRVTTFKGYTFYVGSIYLYANKELLQLLVEASGGVIVCVSDKPKYMETSHQLNKFLIVPSVVSKLQRWMSAEEVKVFLHMPRASEENVVAAALAGQMDQASLQIPSSPVASASSDETVEAADSEGHGDEEVSPLHVLEQTAFSTVKRDTTEELPTTSCFQSREDRTVDKKTSMLQSQDLSAALIGSLPTRRGQSSLFMKQVVVSEEQFKGVRKHPHGSTICQAQDLKGADRVEIQNMKPIKREGTPNSTSGPIEDSKADVIYSKDLIVCKGGESAVRPVQNFKNFKNFRKKEGISGNSFAALVPFAKEPYRESDYGKEVQQYMLQEKRRKQAEALAEDLFNADQLKRQKGAAVEVAGRLGVSSSQQKRPGRVKAR